MNLNPKKTFGSLTLPILLSQTFANIKAGYWISDKPDTGHPVRPDTGYPAGYLV
jgi:hypothetical protein